MNYKIIFRRCLLGVAMFEKKIEMNSYKKL